MSPYLSDLAGSFQCASRYNNTNDNKIAYQNNAWSNPSLNGTGWHDQDSVQPITLIGNKNMTDVSINADFYLPNDGNTIVDTNGIISLSKN